MNRLSLIAAMAVLCLTFDVQGQQRIASIQNFMGEVEVEHSNQVVRPLKIGKVIRNGDVFDGDTVRTRKGEADMLLMDGSVLRMDQNTTLYMGFEAIQAAGAGAPSAVDRKVRLLVGRIWCDVKESRTSTTKFELPEGVAAVRGTVVEFNVASPESWDVTVDRGPLTLTHTGVGATMSLKNGHKVGVTKGSAKIANLGTGPVEIALADGSKLTEFDPGELVDIDRDPDGIYRITMLKGSAVFVSASGKRTTIGEGQSVTSEGAQAGGAGGLGLTVGGVPSVQVGGGGGSGAPLPPTPPTPPTPPVTNSDNDHPM